MARKERIEAEVDIKTKGLSKAQSGIQKLRANWLDFAGDLAEPMLLLATGATKAQALWGGLQGVFITRVLGPMGMVAGASAALLAVTGKIVKAWKEVGMSGAAGLARMTLEFRPLLGSIDLARQRVTELYRFTASTPFKLAGVAKANKILQSLTGGMLATEDGMKLVGDSAAVAGVGIDETARSVGRLYDGLMSGRPVGEASMRLQELGLVSGQTRNAIETMQAANISGMKIWQMVERELGRNQGAMKDLSAELEGLQSTLEDTRDIAQAGFSKGFMEGEKEAVKSATKAWEAMTPVLEYLGRQLGTISNALQAFKSKIVGVVTGSNALVGVIKLAATAFLVFNAAVLIAAGAALGKFLVSVLRVSVATKAQLATMAADTTNKVVNAKVTESLAAAQVRLGAAYGAAKTGAFASAAAHLKAAAASTIAAARTNLAATSAMLFSGVLKGMGLAIGFVVKSLRAMAVALLANPIMATVTVVLALGAALLHLKNKWDDAAKSIESYKRASDAVVNSIKNQRAAIQTVNDARKAEARILSELTKAYREQAVAARDGDTMAQNIADNKIIAIQAELKALRELNAEKLRRSTSEAEQEEKDYQDSKVVEQMEEDRRFEQADDDERVVIAKEQAEEKRRKFNAARQDMNAEKRTAAEVQKLGQKDQERKAQLEAEIAEMEGEFAARDEENRDGGSHDNKVARDKVDSQLKAKRKELAEIEAETGLAAQTEAGARSDSEVARLKAKINLYTTLKEAQQELSSANQALAEAQGGDSEADGFEDKLNAARSRASKAQADLDALQQVRDRLANPFDDSAGQSAAEVDLKDKLGSIEEQEAVINLALNDQATDVLEQKQAAIRDKKAAIQLKLETENLDAVESGKLKGELNELEGQEALINLMVEDDATEEIRAKYTELQGLIAEVELKLESGDLSEVESGELQEKLNSLNGQLAVVNLALQDDASSKLQSIQAGIEDKKAKLVVELENIPEREIDRLQMNYAEVERAGDAKAILEMALEDNATEKLKERQEQIKDRKAVVELALDKEGLAPLEKGELEKELQRLQYQDRVVRVVTEEIGLDEIREELELADGVIVGLGVEVLGRDKVFDLRAQLNDMEDKERIVRLALQGDDEAKSRLGSIKDNLDIEEAQIRLSMTKEGLDEAALEKLQSKLDDVDGQRVLVDVALAGSGGVDDLLAKQQEIRDKKAAIKLELEKDGLDPLVSGELQDKLAALEQQESLIELAIKPGNEEALKNKLDSLGNQKVKIQSEIEKTEARDALITDERGLEDAQNDLARLEEQRSKDATESEVIKSENRAEDVAKDRGESLDRSKLSAEEAVAQLKLEGLAAEEKALEIAYEKLQLAIEQKKISGGEAEDAKKVLDARKAALALKAQEAKETLENRVEGKQGALQERIARSEGDLKGVAEARKRQDAAADAEKEKALRKEAQKVSSDPVEIERIVKEGMEVFRGEREFARKQQEEDELLQRRRSRGDMNQAEANITAEMFKQSGKTKEGKAFQEQEQRRLDEVKRLESEKKFIDQGFSAEEAGSMADREVKVSQAQRAMDMLKEQGTGQVVASSLAKIGGGGGVSGTDPNTKILEKMEQILRDIRDQDKENVVNVF